MRATIKIDASLRAAARGAGVLPPLKASLY
jgi:hypothetical protein